VNAQPTSKLLIKDGWLHDSSLTKQVTEFKATRKMPYADCFATALAKVRKAELVTGD